MSQQSRRNDGRMVIELSRSVEVQCFHIVGEVGFAQRRDELRAVVQLAHERGGQLTAHELCTHLLGGKPDVVGVRLLAVCEQMGLVEGGVRGFRGDVPVRLTEDGVRAAQGGDIFVPERGTWTVWVANDPLIPSVERLLRVDPYREPTAFEEVVGKKDRPREERRQAIELPEWVQDACSVYGLLSWGDGRAISMLDIEEKGEPAEPEAHVSLALRVAPGESPTVRLSGSIQGRRAEYELPREHVEAPDFDEVWRHCLGSQAHAWDGSSLAVPFAKLDDKQRADFEGHFSFGGWTHPVHGSFGPYRVPHVKLRPASDLDASLWGNWLLTHRTQSYVRKTDFAERCEELREVFAGYRLQLMTQPQLAASVRSTSGARPGRKYWHLQAPLDWTL